MCLGPRRVAAPAELVGKKHDLTGLSDTNNKQNNMPKASFRKCNRLRPHGEITEEMIKGSIKNSSTHQILNENIFSTQFFLSNDMSYIIL